MKRLISVLIVALVLCALAACTEDNSSQTTTHNASGNHGSNSTTLPYDDTNSTTSHIHSVNTTTVGVDGTHDGDEIDDPTNPDDDPDNPQGDSDTQTTTVGGTHTTTGNVITTTTKKGETTTSNKLTTTTTTKKTTTTTTKKTTTTTTKKTTTTKNHSFAKATYKRVDIDKHTATEKCSICGFTVTQTEWHTWGAWKYDVQPTATKDGVKYRVCTGCGEEQVTVAPATSINTSNYAQEVFELVNAERAKYKLPAYKYYTAGQSGANTRAKELMTCFSHNRPDGSKWWTVSSFDKSICQAGAENIARGYGSPEDVVKAFMASPDHRSKILSTEYTHIVIGYYEGAWVQIFVKPW